VADRSKFGGPKQFGDTTAGNLTGDSGNCARCEAMLADALDGTLSAEDQAMFDRHMAECGPCSQLLADAKRGAAWLEMLRDPQPEPPADLLEKILAQTSGGPIAVPATRAADTLGAPALAPGYAHVGRPAGYGKVLSFPQRVMTSLKPVGMQPRLAMTAAMAFFSIALTMNLTGVRVTDLSLRPSTIKRQVAHVNASVARYYEGLRVVYELESRLRDFQAVQGDENSRPQETAPQQQNNPGQQQQKQPGQTKPESNQRHGSAPPAGASRDDRPRPMLYTKFETPVVIDRGFAKVAEMVALGPKDVEGTLV
jgi:hypothetical protein